LDATSGVPLCRRNVAGSTPITNIMVKYCQVHTQHDPPLKRAADKVLTTLDLASASCRLEFKGVAGCPDNRVACVAFLDAINAKFCIFKLRSISQAGRRGFDPRPPLHLFSITCRPLIAPNPEMRPFRRPLTDQIGGPCVEVPCYQCNVAADVQPGMLAFKPTRASPP